jgi:hypothetical protein
MFVPGRRRETQAELWMTIHAADPRCARDLRRYELSFDALLHFLITVALFAKKKKFINDVI